MARKTKEQIQQERETQLVEFKNSYIEYFHDSYREEAETTEAIAVRADFAERVWSKMLKEYSFAELELFNKYLSSPIVKKMQEAKIKTRYGDLIVDVHLDILVEEVENTDLDEVGSWDFDKEEIIPPVRH